MVQWCMPELARTLRGMNWPTHVCRALTKINSIKPCPAKQITVTRGEDCMVRSVHCSTWILCTEVHSRVELKFKRSWIPGHLGSFEYPNLNQ